MMGPTGRKPSEPAIQRLKGAPLLCFVKDEVSDTAECTPTVVLIGQGDFTGLPEEVAAKLEEWDGDPDYSIFEQLVVNPPPPPEPILYELLQNCPPCEDISAYKEPEKNPYEGCYGTDEYSMGACLTAYGKACKRKANKAERQRKKKARKRNRKR